MKLYIKLSIITILTFTSIFAQEVIQPTKQVTFGSKLHTNRDILNSAVKDSNNNFYLIGTTEDDFTFNDIEIIKLDENLSEIWRKTISFKTDFSFDRIMDSYLDSNENLVLICKSAFNKLGEVIVAVKLNSDGEELWRIPFGNLQNPQYAIDSLFYNTHLDANDFIHIAYKHFASENESRMFFVEISPEGLITNEYEKSDFYGVNKYPFTELHYKDGYYHYIERQGGSSLQFNHIKFNEQEYVKKQIELSEQQISLFASTGEKTILTFDNDGNPVWIGIHQFYYGLNYVGYSVVFLNKNGELAEVIDVDNTQDKYYIGSTFDTFNNLIIVSNNKNKDSEDSLAFSLQKYDYENHSEQTFTNPTSTLGIVPFFEETFFGLYTNTNEILKYDYNFNRLNEISLNPIEAEYFYPTTMLFYGENTYIGGTNESSIYEGSDFRSQRDWNFKKASSTIEIKQFTFSGEGTSKSFSNKSIQKDDDGNYIVAISEKAGPDNLNIGGSRSPYRSHIIKYSSDLEYISKSTASNAENYNDIWEGTPDYTKEFELNGNKYAYHYDYITKEFTLSKNEVLQWTRIWNTSLYAKPWIEFLVNSKGDLIFSTSSGNGSSTFSSLNSISIDNQLTRREEIPYPDRIAILDNDWIFTFTSYSTIVYSEDFDFINEAPLEGGGIAARNYNNIFMKNNKIFVHGTVSKLLKVYDQYGDFEKELILDGDTRDRYAFFEGDDLIMLGHIGSFIIREYSWQRSTISKYENFEDNLVGEISYGDSDQDGVNDFIDRCPNTPFGNLVTEYGCNAISADTINFTNTITSGTCPNSINGSARFETQNEHNYTLTLSNDEGVSVIKEFTTVIEIDGLTAGNYNACITAIGNSNFKSCYGFVISEPAPLNVSSKIDSDSKELILNFEGGKLYTITLNDKVINTTEDKIVLPLDQNLNTLIVSADHECQGIYEEKILLASEQMLFPNPVSSGNISLTIDENISTSGILSLYTIDGQELFKGSQSVQNGILDFNIDDLSSGIYLLKLSLKDKVLTFKMIKK